MGEKPRKGNPTGSDTKRRLCGNEELLRSCRHHILFSLVLLISWFCNSLFSHICGLQKFRERRGYPHTKCQPFSHIYFVYSLLFLIQLSKSLPLSVLISLFFLETICLPFPVSTPLILVVSASVQTKRNSFV